jgi:integrase
MSRSRSGRSRIETDPQSVLQPAHGGDVHPAGPSGQIGDGLPVHPGQVGQAPQAEPLPLQLYDDFMRNGLDDPGLGVGDVRIGPSLRIPCQLPRRGTASSSSGHADAILTLAVHTSDISGYLVSRFEWSVRVEADVSSAVMGYHPKYATPEWDLVADGVRMLALTTSGAVTYEILKVMQVLGALAVFAEQQGLERDPLVWLRPDVVNRFIIRLPRQQSTVQTYRSIINRVREAVLWLEQRQPPDLKLRARKTRPQPYSPTELARYAMWAHTLPANSDAGLSARAFLSLGAGCGLPRRELLAARGTDVHLQRNGVVLRPPGSSRLLLCRRAWEKDLASLAEQVGDGYLFYPQRLVEDPKNCTTNWADRITRDVRGLPRLRLARLRSSWIVELLRKRIPDDVVADAAGMRSTSALAPYREFVPPLTADEAARMLRG